MAPLLPPVCSSVPSEQPRDNVHFSEWSEIVRLAMELTDSDNVLEGTVSVCVCVCMRACVCDVVNVSVFFQLTICLLLCGTN